MILFHYITCSFFFLWDYDIFIISLVTFSTQIFHVIFSLFIICPSRALKKELKKSLWQYSCGVLFFYIFNISMLKLSKCFFLLEKLMNVFLTLISNYLCFIYIYILIAFGIYWIKTLIQKQFYCRQHLSSEYDCLEN